MTRTTASSQDTAAHPGPDPAGCPSGDGACAHALSRRGLLRTAAVAGTAVTAGAGLSGCSSLFHSNDGTAAAGSADTNMASAAPSSASASTPVSAPSSPAAMADSSSAAAATHASGILLGHSSQIPEGGGVIYSAHQVVVTQPSTGRYKAFSAACTHAGCQCNEVTGGQITCPCHGAAFSIADGSPVAGPAHSPLAVRTVTVQNGEVRLQA